MVFVTCQECQKTSYYGSTHESSCSRNPIKKNPEETIYKCTNCGGSILPGAEKCRYCGYYINSLGRAMAILKAPSPPQPYNPTPYAPKKEESMDTHSFLKGIIYFAIVLCVVAAMGSIFTFPNIRAQGVAGLLGVLMFLGFLKAIRL